MTSTERKALEDAGWEFGDAEDFLDLTDDERRLVDEFVVEFRHAHEDSDCPLCREHPVPNAETIRAMIDMERGVGLLTHADVDDLFRSPGISLPS